MQPLPVWLIKSEAIDYAFLAGSIACLILVVLMVGELLARGVTQGFARRYFQEFPRTSLAQLRAFTTHHPTLGWEPKPTTTSLPDTGRITLSAGDDFRTKGNNQLSMYRINQDGSRFCPPSANLLLGGPIEVFGDSSAFCRENNDDETYSYFLERDHGIGPTSNFGVGNYGIDQSYLRAVDRMQGGGVAILDIALQSIYRNVTVYKHYSEIGNSWAVKPRFILSREGRELELLGRPFEDRDAITDLGRYEEHFRYADFFFQHWRSFAPSDRVSHLRYLLKSRHALVVATERLPEGRVRSALVHALESLNYVPYKPHKNPEILVDISSGEGGEILARIVAKFIALSRSRNALPLVFFSPQGHLLNFPSHCAAITKNLGRHFAEYGITEVPDFGDVLFSMSKNRSSELGAHSVHLSPEGNRVKAKWLADQILDLSGC